MSPSMVQARRSRIWVAVAWAALVLAFWWAAQAGEGSASRQVARWLDAAAASPWGLPAFLGLYLLRPLLLLPVTVLTVFAGFLFGPWLGLPVALLGMLVSSTWAYLLARWLGAASVPSGPWVERLRRRTFETVMASCLAFLPGDLVNGVSGALRLSYPAFIAASAIGGLPGTAMAVFAGAALEGTFRFEGLRLRPAYLAASLSMAALSVGLSLWLRRRRGVGPAPGGPR